MAKRAHDKIMAGLRDAISYSSGKRSGAARVLLNVIERNPKAVQAAISA